MPDPIFQTVSTEPQASAALHAALEALADAIEGERGDGPGRTPWPRSMNLKHAIRKALRAWKRDGCRATHVMIGPYEFSAMTLAFAQRTMDIPE
ncbi:MAG: hypothetical protein GVY18_04540 [Bacteroidetes bacterium]|jgi:hypothetical protein|nr:hypothetical protein [Bacteroidota bacterium]